MLDFEYYNPVKVIFGKGSIKKLANLVPQHVRLGLLFGRGSIKANGVYQQCLDALGQRIVCEFGGIGANPEYRDCLKARDAFIENNVDFILAVGGGSVIDAAKLVAAAVSQPNLDPWDLVKDASLIQTALPIATVLTVPAAGSEMNTNAVISRSEIPDKLGFSSQKLYPVFSILDPETSYSLPDRQSANGIVDTFVHVCEQYLTSDENTPVQDRFAEGILKTLVHYGPRVFAAPHDYQLRANLMWASTVALSSIIGVGVKQDWATHAIGHELTALYGLDHARSLAVVLPGVLSVRKKQKSAKLLMFAKNVWGLDQGDEEVLMDEAIGRTVLFFESLGLGTRLSDYKLDQSAVDQVVSRIAAKGWCLGEDQGIGPEQLGSILQSRLG